MEEQQMQIEKQALNKIAYSPSDVMRITGLGRNTVYELLAAQKLYAKRVGRRWLIPKGELERWLNEQ